MSDDSYGDDYNPLRPEKEDYDPLGREKKK
jgi:hypothetical protein